MPLNNETLAFLDYGYYFCALEFNLFKCCILTIDRAVNEIFSAQDAPLKISESSHVGREMVGVMKSYMLMLTWELESEWQSVNASLQRSVESTNREPWPQGAKWTTVDYRLSTSRRKRKGKALKITQRGMVTRRSYGSIRQSIFVSHPPSFSLTLASSMTSFENKEWEL